MSEYLIQGKTLTTIADEVRELNGTTETMSLETMANNINEANEEIVSQADLLTQVATALEGRAIPSIDTTLLWSNTFADTVVDHHHEIVLGFDLTVGTKYLVVFDGVEYTVTCENLAQHAMLAIGNKHLASNTYEDTGEPFFIYQKTGTETGQFMLVKTAGSHVVEIYLPASTVTPPDENTPDTTLLWSNTFAETVVGHHHEIVLGFDLTVGQRYLVVFDGVEYTVTCENILQHAMLAIGNKHIVVDTFADTEEPFFIYQKTGTQTGQFMLVNAAGSHTVEIYLYVANGGSSSGGNANALFGKNVLIIGDSVNAGNGWEGGFANLINEDFSGVIVHNASVSGSKLAGEQIYYQMVNEYQAGFAPDYVVFNGGGNDILTNVTEGTLDPDTYDNFNTNTIVGAFEQLVFNAQKYLPNAKLIFVILYKLNPLATEITYAKQRQVWDLLRETCQKYGVYYVDLYNEGNFTPAIQEQWDAFMFDWIHINEAGYRRFWPLIKNALLTI